MKRQVYNSCVKKHLGKKRRRSQKRLYKSEDGSVHGQGTSAGYEITDGHSVLPHGNPTKGIHLEEGRRDGGEKN